MNKTLAIIIIILIIVAGVWWLNSGSNGVSSLYSTASPSIAAATNAPVYGTTHKAAASPTPSLSYTQAVAEYGTNRIQFDASCQAQPKSVVFKNGTSIMLDNRANQTRVIGLNGNNYTLGAYGFQIVTLSSSVLPKNLSLSCNNLVNVGTINLEANISGQ